VSVSEGEVYLFREKAPFLQRIKLRRLAPIKSSIGRPVLSANASSQTKRDGSRCNHDALVEHLEYVLHLGEPLGSFQTGKLSRTCHENLILKDRISAGPVSHSQVSN
jgi:hypothetical protein